MSQIKIALIIPFFLCLFPPEALAQDVVPGAERPDAYLKLLQGKNVALAVNKTSRAFGAHLIDYFQKQGVKTVKVFSPEHGLRGDADAGQEIEGGHDKKTGLLVVSLYGKKRKPNKKDMEGVDAVVFDMQDVGARFYTYISTMHYLMEACARDGVDFIVLDRPNPLIKYIAGPVREKKYKSFVGMHPIPVLHGMTVGELAQMINGEGWLKGGVKCNLTVVACANYRRSSEYRPPVAPSPNLPNYRAVRFYPSLCFFEATEISVGRGTDKPFQQYGGLSPKYGAHTFTPTSKTGASAPKYKNKKCYGKDLSRSPFPEGLTYAFLIEAYKNCPNKSRFFTRPSFFNLLAGNDKLLRAIKSGKTEEQIRQSQEKGLAAFRKRRKPYLLYPE